MAHSAGSGRGRSITHVGQRHTADSHSNAIRQHFAFNFDQAADPADDPRSRIEQLMRAGAAGELERSDRGDAEAATRRGALVATRRGEPSGLREKLDQHDGWHDGIIGKVALKVPVLRPGDAEPAGRYAIDKIGDLLDEPHRRSMREQVNSERA